MSSQMKLGLLALISTVAAVPHYGHHSRFHKPSGGYGGHGTGSAHSPAYPTGGWGGHENNTALPLPTGTGAGYPVDDKTTTILETQYSTETLVSTIYATKPTAGGYGEAPSSVGAADVSTGAAACGPETVYVTATNKVTVTVPAGGAPSSIYTPPSSIAEPTSEAPVYVAPSSAAEEKVSLTSLAEKPVYTPAPSSVVVYSTSEAPVETPVPTSEAPVPTSEAPAPTSEAPASSAAPVSSATPTPSTAPTSPTYSGSKRGLAYNDITLCSAFTGAKFGFAYNWGSTEGGSLPDGVKYVPMMHKPADATPEKWLSDVDTAVKGGSTVVMGFNEPDHSAQANLTPEQACSDWTNYMEPIVSSHPDVTILGPSVTNGAAPMGLDWLSRFQTACPDATWHGANIHFYDVYDDQTVERLKTQVEKAADLYKKPVWLTEFGLNPGSATSEQAATFLKAALEYLDGSDSVQGYSWFMVGTDQSMNMLNTANGLSATGEVYASA